MPYHTPKPPSEVFLTYLNEHYVIEPVLGKIFNKNGEEVGYIEKTNGYVWIDTARGRARRHHIVWWKHTGEWPTSEIDHDNLIRHDDRIENLKLSTRRNNMANNSKVNGLPTGVVKLRGYYKTRPYKAQINISNKTTYLGTFATPEEAAQAYQDAKARLT